MKRYLVLVLMLLIPISVQARSVVGCDVTVLSNMKSLASNINISYQYRIENNQAYFDVTINNITPDIYFTDNTNGNTYNYSNTNNGEIIITGYTNIEKVNYTFYTSDRECNGKSLITKYVSFPTYNQYYGDEVCKGVENYSLCKRWNKYTGTYEEFKNKVNSYKNSKQKVEKPEQKEELVETILSFVIRYIYIAIIIAVIVIGIIYYRRSKDKFDFKV